MFGQWVFGRVFGCEMGAACQVHGCAARVNRWVPERVARAVRSSGRAFRPDMRAHRRDARECVAPLVRQAAFWPGEGERACACAVRRAFWESRYRATLSLLGWLIKNSLVSGLLEL